MKSSSAPQAILLCGGRGTRLSALYSDRPKVLVPIAGRPFLAWQLEWLARNGVRDVHLAAGHQADILRTWVMQAARNAERGTQSEAIYELSVLGHAVLVSVSVETTPLGTAGGLKFVEPFIHSDPFLVLNGDSLMLNLDFCRFAAEHGEGTTRWATIAVAPIGEPGRYGTVEFSEQGTITAFREKTHSGTGWINGGVYLMSRRCLGDIEPGKNLSIETDIFPRLAADGRLYAFRGEPPLLDMGTPEGIRALESFLAERDDKREA